MSHNYPTGSKGNCTPRPVDGDKDLTVAGDTPDVLDTRGKALRETYEAGDAPLSLPGGKRYPGPEASPDKALREFTTAKAGGRYGGNKTSPADIPLSSNGPETRDGS